MSGQTIRWAIAFAATVVAAASVGLSAADVPAPPPAEAQIVLRDPAGVGAVELELILNKIREGDLLALKKDEAGARRAWAEARRQGEGLWPIHEGLADSFARAKLFNEALLEYRVAEDCVPPRFGTSKIEIAAKRAAAIGAAGRTLEAIQAYLDLNQPAMFGSRIFNLALDGDRGAAVRVIERHAEVYDPRLFRIVGGLLRSMDRRADAAEALAKVAVRVEPWGDALNREVIRELREAKRFEPALEVGRAWVRAVPESAEGFIAIGDVLWDAGRTGEAVEAYSSIVNARPADPALRQQLGQILERRGRFEEAVAQFEAGLKIQPQHQNLQNCLVEALQTRLVVARAAGKGSDVVRFRRRLGELNGPDGLFDLKVVITWDVMSDVDLDVFEPDGTRINHQNRASKVGGVYLKDNTTGLGPETYTLLHAAPGKYQIGAHLHSGAKSVVKFVTLLYEGTSKEERREETLVIEQVGESTHFIRDVVIP
jgi:tetratricopeptide (TPR) repeat protein